MNIISRMMLELSAITLYRIGNWFYRHKLKPISNLFTIIIFFLFNSFIPSEVEIGRNTKIGYRGIGVVINDLARIGEHCMIGTGVTVGGKSGSKGAPVIEDNVCICTGAKVLGDIRIGHDSIIGANAVVIHDVPPFSVMGGIPAKRIAVIDEENYFIDSQRRHS